MVRHLSDEDKELLISPQLSRADADRIMRKQLKAAVVDDAVGDEPISITRTLLIQLVQLATGANLNIDALSNSDTIVEIIVLACGDASVAYRKKLVLGPSPVRSLMMQSISAAQSSPFHIINFNAKKFQPNSASTTPLTPTPFEMAGARVHQLLYSRLSLVADKSFIEELVRAAQIEFDRSSIEDPIKRAEKITRDISLLPAVHATNFPYLSVKEWIAKEILDAEQVAFKCGRNEASTESKDGLKHALLMKASLVKVLDERIKVSRLYANSRPFHRELLVKLESIKQEMEQLKPEDLQ